MKFTKFELLRYFLCQNRFVWQRLSQEKKDIIFNSNIVHNNIREDYKNPENYQSGLNYYSNEPRDSIYRGKVVLDVMNRYNFESALEIGPGAGFITKSILQSGIKQYTAIDIVEPFLTFCKSAIEKDENIICECDFIHSDICDVKVDKKYDVIFFLSALHHIPNREEFMNSLIPFCHENTIIVSVEPTHYLQRILRIIKNLPKFLSKEFVLYNNYENLSTHHFLTLNEFQSFQNFDVIEYGFGYSKKLPFKFSRYLSNEMYALLKVKSFND